MPLIRSPRETPAPAAASRIQRDLASASVDRALERRARRCRPTRFCTRSRRCIGARDATRVCGRRFARPGAHRVAGERRCPVLPLSALRRRLDSHRGAGCPAYECRRSCWAPVLPKLLVDPDADVRLLTCELVRESSPRQLDDFCLCRPRDRQPAERLRRRQSMCSAEIGGADAIPALARCAARFSRRCRFWLCHPVDSGRSAPAFAPWLTGPGSPRKNFSRLCDYLYRRTGMIFNDTRRYFVDRRIDERMVATRATSFASYFARLRGNLDGEIEHFVNAFTVNETYFYREDHQLRCLTSDLLASASSSQANGRADPDLVDALLDGRRALFDRDVAIGELARGRLPRHRNHWLRYRHRSARRRPHGNLRQTRADAPDARSHREIFRTCWMGRAGKSWRTCEIRSSFRPRMSSSGTKHAPTVCLTSFFAEMY